MAVSVGVERVQTMAGSVGVEESRPCLDKRQQHRPNIQSRIVALDYFHLTHNSFARPPDH